MTTPNRLSSAALLRDWEQETREHAERIREAATAELRQHANNTPSVAEWIRLIDQELTYPGPWVRAYDNSANNGNGAYVWVNGWTVIGDHAVAEVRMASDRWTDIQKLSASWPSRPCSESYVESPAAVDDPQSFPEDDVEAHWCPGCENIARIVRYNDVWERIPHRVDGTPITFQ
jgi:hypothetical protein